MLCAAVKVAVTLLAASIVTWQVLPLPAHAPLQPPKREPAVGVAVRVTTVLGTKAALQVVPQSIPTGLLVTVPLPLPALLTVSSGLVVTTTMTVVVTG
ncbi:MAG: hypothetical protein DYG89_32525 [Caldilinea sp. CFX5]|nr:hypothetical protein [Caldilinea sp. CFX5]